jgi:hypothetical protein
VFGDDPDGVRTRCQRAKLLLQTGKTGCGKRGAAAQREKFSHKQEKTAFGRHRLYRPPDRRTAIVVSMSLA